MEKLEKILDNIISVTFITSAIIGVIYLLYICNSFIFWFLVFFMFIGLMLIVDLVG